MSQDILSIFGGLIIAFFLCIAGLGVINLMLRPNAMQVCIESGYEWSRDEFGESCVKAIPDLWNGE